MKMHYIHDQEYIHEVYPTEEKQCLCKIVNDNGDVTYNVATPFILNKTSYPEFISWDTNDGILNIQDVVAWIYIDELNLA